MFSECVMCLIECESVFVVVFRVAEDVLTAAFMDTSGWIRQIILRQVSLGYRTLTCSTCAACVLTQTHSCYLAHQLISASTPPPGQTIRGGEEMQGNCLACS